MNGTLVMESKDPFDFQGLSVSAQSGMMDIVPLLLISQPRCLISISDMPKRSPTVWRLKLQLHT